MNSISVFRKRPFGLNLRFFSKRIFFSKIAFLCKRFCVSKVATRIELSQFSPV